MSPGDAAGPQRGSQGPRVDAGSGTTSTIATATVQSAAYNGDGAWLLHVRCTFCGGQHRHAWQASDPELATVQRDASCGRGAYVLVGLEQVIA